MAVEPFILLQVSAGSASYDLSSDLSSLSIRETVGSAAELRFVVSDPFKVFGSALHEGMRIEVDIGTKKDHSFVFRGQLSKIQFTFSEDGVPRINVQANDDLIQMALHKVSKTISDNSLKSVVCTVARPYFGSIKFNFSDDPVINENVLRQQAMTDLYFLNSLADDLGCAIFAFSEPKQTTLLFRSRAGIMQGDSDAVLRHGSCAAEDSLIDFEVESDATKIELGTIISAMDPRTGATIVAQSKLPHDDQTEISHNETSFSDFKKRYPEKAEKLSRLIGALPDIKAQHRKRIGTRSAQQLRYPLDGKAIDFCVANTGSTCREGLFGRGSTRGNHHLFASGLIEIKNIGARLSGKWYLSEVEHVVDERGYLTNFKCQK